VSGQLQEQLTVVQQKVVRDDAKSERNKIEEEVSVVVDTNTVVNPRAVAKNVS
jgi:hypothetical protein